MANINLSEIGTVTGEILWVSGRLVKIKYKKPHWLFSKTHVEVFHMTEVLNFNEIYNNNNIKILV